MWIKIGKWNASFGQKERTFAVIHSVWLILGWYLSLLHVVIIWQLWKKSPSLVSLGYYLYYLRADWKIASEKRSAFQNWKEKKNGGSFFCLFTFLNDDKNTFQDQNKTKLILLIFQQQCWKEKKADAICWVIENPVAQPQQFVLHMKMWNV